MASVQEPVYIFSTFRSGFITAVGSALALIAIILPVNYVGGLDQLFSDPLMLFVFVLLLLMLGLALKDVIKPDRFEFYEEMVRINGVDFQCSEMTITDLIEPGYYFLRGYRMKISVKIKSREQSAQSNVTEADTNHVKIKRYELHNYGIKKFGGLSLYS